MRASLFEDKGVKWSQRTMKTWLAKQGGNLQAAAAMDEATEPATTISKLEDLRPHDDFLKQHLSATPDLGRTKLCSLLRLHQNVICKDWWMRAWLDRYRETIAPEAGEECKEADDDIDNYLKELRAKTGWG